MKNMRYAVVVVAALGSVLVAGVANAAVEQITVIGKVSIVEDDDWNIISVKLTTDAGMVYQVTLDEKGRAMGSDMNDVKVKVTGTVALRSNVKWLSVLKYEEVEEELAPEAED